MHPGQGREHRPEVIAAVAPRLPQRRRVFRRLAIATSSHPLPLNPQYGVSRLPPVWRDRRVMSHFPHFATTLFSSLSVGVRWLPAFVAVVIGALALGIPARAAPAGLQPKSNRGRDRSGLRHRRLLADAHPLLPPVDDRRS